MSQQLRIGVVGIGAIGRTHVERINSSLRHGTVIAVSDVQKEFGQAYAKEQNCTYYSEGKELINAPDVDAVIVTTIDEYHEMYVLEAIKAGKFCFVEKPLAPDLPGCRNIVKQEIAGGKKLVQVGFMRRYDPGYLQLKELVNAKTYGEPLMLHCAHRNFSVPESYTTAMAIENTMIHEIDVLRWLLNEDYVSVEVAFPRKTKYAHEKLQDPQIMYLTTESGVRIDVEAFVNCHYGYDIQCEICFEEGIARLPEPANAMVRTKASRLTPICETWSERFVEAYNREVQSWINACLEGKVEGPDSWDGYMGQKVAAAASQARDTRTLVNIAAEPCPEFYQKNL
jgi:myo-inositol 2-dehydrogenase/D-chiro-inositol 1-dehydrogenase